MVDFTLPDNLNEEFISKIPEQKNIVKRLLIEGKLLTYALSLESQKLWAIFNGDSEVEVLELISKLPLTKYMQVRISEISTMSYTSAIAPAPVFSVN